MQDQDHNQDGNKNGNQYQKQNQNRGQGQNQYQDQVQDFKLQEKIPQHLAIIMDGNGRWALKRHHHRFFGHVRGARVAEEIIHECLRLKIPYLTLYVFSIENCLRPEKEVLFLLRIFYRYLLRRKQSSIYQKIRFSVLGDTSHLPSYLQEEIAKTVEESKSHVGMHLSLCFNYGGRQDIVNASKEIGKALLKGSLTLSEINLKSFSSFLGTSSLPNPDLILRTSGEYRLSNFLLWEAAYTEMIFVDTLWPDFKREDLQCALKEYGKRIRRFGLLHPSSEASPNETSFNATSPNETNSNKASSKSQRNEPSKTHHYHCNQNHNHRYDHDYDHS